VKGYVAMNRTKISLLWAVGLTIIALIFWVTVVLDLAESPYDGVTIGYASIIALSCTVAAARFYIQWNRVRHGAQDSRIDERIIAESKKANSWLSWAVIECSIFAIMSLVFFGREVTKSPRNGEDVWFGAVAAVFFTVAAIGSSIGLYIYWKRKKRKPE
jgi:O-antigen/teichoic acid export membrane protein